MLCCVNFYGHAVVASWFGTQPAFVLGAMLPDFLSMLGWLRPSLGIPSSNKDLLAGVALHRATDAAFHDIPEFIELLARAREELSSAGLSRGTSRAVAHIGVEMLLDEALTSDPTGRNAYLAALEYTRSSELPVAWPLGQEPRFRELTIALSGRGLPETPAPANEVARRLRRVLAPRPRLAFETDGDEAVSRWVTEARPAVRVNAPVILGELRSRLSVESALAN